MAELSRSELDLLISGASAIAQMRELGIPQEELQGILQAGAQRFGNTVSRGQTDGSLLGLISHLSKVISETKASCRANRCSRT